MSQFYSRYVPPSTNIQKSIGTAEPSQKRKRSEGVEQPTKQQDRKIHESKRVKTESEPEDIAGTAVEEKKSKGESRKRNGHTILDKYRVSEAAKAQDDAADVKFRKSTAQPRTGKRKADRLNGDDLRRPKTDVEQELLVENNPESQKHANILSKFNKSKDRIPTDHETPEVGQATEKTEVHGLEPIPQPRAVQPQNGKPTYSTLPAWQSGATKIDRASRKSLKEMGLSKDTLANLKRHKIQEAFPVQSVLVPMLLEQDPEVAGDVCVSAATGSGKTLAYVVPIVQALREKARNGLRAVIVVPTRELVKQVRETCDMCASGSSLRIVTAVGSKSLKDEQDTLILKEEIYDPEEYERRQKAPIDWSNFSLEATLERAQTNHPTILPGYVERTSMRADILITTPGRLVDHLKNTPGFNLDHAEWLVVDEADRLLNESYQEWIDIVVPALTSRNATKERDEILSHMRLDLPPRVVRKILLSATMTQDITKLNALGLQDPKLVVLRSTETSSSIENANGDMNGFVDEPEPDASGSFNLPMTLDETVLTFKDGADKPLILLKLLEEQILAKAVVENEPSSDETSDTDSSDETSESENDSDTDSASTSSVSTDETSSDESSDDSSRDTEAPRDDERFIRHRDTNDLTDTTKTDTPRMLIFTHSTASASRLSRLLSLLSADIASRITTLTRSTASSASSRQALTSFRTGKTSILIATDRASRGIDVPGLEHVVNYDIPGSALTYIHRVGRTARAGKGGHAWTLVEHREGRWFWNEIGGKNDDGKIRRMTKVKKIDAKIEDAALREQYEHALQTLGGEVSGQ